MSPETLAPAAVAVVIPARNESDRIDACLRALAQGAGATGAHVILVANNCTDDTASRARASAGRQRLSLSVIDCQLPPDRGVGSARRIGCAFAMRTLPGLAYLLTTDADSQVAPDWIARSISHLGEVAAVCGRIGPIESEQHLLDALPAEAGLLEAQYRDLVLRFYHRFAPEPANPGLHHGEASGASLGFRARDYRAIGGFADLRCGEDRDIIRRLKQSGRAVRHADDVLARVSCRLVGRAPGGMADALSMRLADPDSPVDDAFLPVDLLLEALRAGALPAWPPEVPAERRLRASDLPGEIARLSRVLADPELVHLGSPDPTVPAAIHLAPSPLDITTRFDIGPPIQRQSAPPGSAFSPSNDVPFPGTALQPNSGAKKETTS